MKEPSASLVQPATRPRPTSKSDRRCASSVTHALPRFAEAERWQPRVLPPPAQISLLPSSAYEKKANEEALTPVRHLLLGDPGKPISSSSVHSYGSVSTVSSDTTMPSVMAPMSVEGDICLNEDEEGQQHNGRPSTPDAFSDTSTIPEAAPGDRGKLSLAGLAVMVFYSVSGGPFGVEASVRSAGNFYTLLGFVVFPFIWSIQEAMMTAELGAAFPEASGGVAWVEEAFGSKWGFLSGFLGWVAGATDNGKCAFVLGWSWPYAIATVCMTHRHIAIAIYPVLFLDYLLEVVNSNGESMNPVTRFLLLAGTSIGLSYVNWMGLPVVGNMSIAICAVAMSPFVILTVVGAFSVDPSRWLEGPTANATVIESIMDDDGGILPISMAGGILLRPFLNNLFWNLNSFDAGASFAEDIDEPGRVLPKAMGYSIVMVVLGYLVPLLVALGASESSQADWEDGYLARVCSEIVGPWLGGWTVFAAGISNIALFQAELSADAFQLMGMAERGHLPKVFATRSRHGTPTFGILLGCAVIVAMGAANVDRLIEMLNFNYAISLLMEYAAFVQLRIRRPDLPRPFRIPLNTTCCIVALVPTFFFTILVLALADYATFVFALVVNAAGLALYYCMRCVREHGCPSSSPIPVALSQCASFMWSKSYERVDTENSTVQTAYSESTCPTVGSREFS